MAAGIGLHCNISYKPGLISPSFEGIKRQRVMVQIIRKNITEKGENIHSLPSSLL